MIESLERHAVVWVEHSEAQYRLSADVLGLAPQKARRVSTQPTKKQWP